MFDDVYALNVKAPFFLVAELAPLMAKQGKGAIVNVSTMVADYGSAGLSLYGSSKAAVQSTDQSLGGGIWTTRAVRVKCGQSTDRTPDRRHGGNGGTRCCKLAAQAQPAGRPAAPEEIAEVIVYSWRGDRASFVQGAIVPVDGGRTARSRF